MTSFHVTTHTIPASHLREYPRGSIAAAINPPQLKLVVNQYTPRSYPRSAAALPGDVSIVFCHANAVHKELYEPYFDHLLTEYAKSGLKIRSIWAPDAAHQGASGVVNEHLLGDDPCWNDLSRDVLHMVNQFSAEMQPPIIGMGHSYGGYAIARLSLMHPSLFTALVLVDPVIFPIEDDYENAPPPNNGVLSVNRLDTWPSMEDAERFVRSRPFYKRWDPRVIDLYLKHAFRPLPTLSYPDQKTGVTLTTAKNQEVLTFIRASPQFKNDAQLGRAEPSDLFRLLPLLVPPVLYLVGGSSHLATPGLRKAWVELTPGADLTVVDGAGHLFPLEVPDRAAKAVAPYLIKQVKKWKEEAESDQATPRPRQLTREFLDRLSKL